MKDCASFKSYKKSPYRSIKHSTYFDVYDDLFSPYRDKEITFVEIGVLGGGSLFMWRDFFGPKARIIGVDLNPAAKKWENEGFEIHIGSQSDEKFWAEFIDSVGKVDIVLDDGGHSYEQQIITTEMLIDNICDGGLLVVEDTHTSYMDGFGVRKYSFIEYVKQLIDKINFRFSAFDDKKDDDRVWSIQIFESIVAFKINRRAVSLPSESTENGGIDDNAADFTYADKRSVVGAKKAVSSFNLLKSVISTNTLKQRIVNFVINRSANTKKFFK
ncbi:MAG: class I SAM-dependent methyltransferase [Desulfovibrionaceae bacterium]